jgi:Flp pilus assembly protein TadD
MSHPAEIARQYYQAGDLPRAEQAAQDALRIDPHHLPTLHLLGVLCHRSGRNLEAIAYLVRAARLDSSNAALHNNLAILYSAAGRGDDALAHFREALRLQPDQAAPHANLGIALAAQDRLAEAVAHFREALRLQPHSANVHIHLGNALAAQGHPGDAERHYREALRLTPNDPAVYGNLAGVLVELGRPDEAVACCREALRLDPGSAGAYVCLGQLAAQNLYQFPEEQFRAVEGLLTSGRLSRDAAGDLHFVLAGLRDRQGDHDRAFAHYRQANDLKAEGWLQKNEAFDPQQHLREIDELIATFDRSFVERVRSFGLDTETPVFVVGMPRSGTTLVEQILASHPQVIGAGELTDLGEILGEAPPWGGPERYPRWMSRLDQATARALAERYLARLTEIGKGAARVIDKLPHNYRHLGALCALFPRARVVHCRRDARDVCLSCYFQNFTGLNFTCSLEHIGFCYRQYERLMRHWRETLPLQLYEVQYEELIADPERVSRELVGFCGLDWDDRCLAFHQNARAVQTASKLQVRRPIYATSVARWKRYEKHLRPLEQALQG